MEILLGPILTFRGLDGDGWHIGALVVTDDGAAPDFACPTANTTGGFELLWEVGGKRALTCRFSVKPGKDARTVDYSVGTAAYQLHVPAAGAAPHMAYGSCNGFSSLKAMKNVRDNNHLWRSMGDQHRAAPFHLLLLGGDQVYADSMWSTVPMMTDWATLGWEEGNAAPATPAMQKALREFYFNLYTSRWAQPEVAEMLARVPTIAMWDDHDLIDGWGSYPGDRQNCAVYRDAIWPAARKAFRTFQQQLKDGEAHPGAIAPERGLSFAHVTGPVAILALDLRSERTDRQILSETHWDHVYEWMDALPDVRHLIVMSSIPVVYPGFDVLERILGFLPGYQDLEDDLRDHWRTRAHKGERLRFIHRLLDLGARKIRPTIVSGDVHVAGLGYVESTRAGHSTSAALNQLISSGIVHPGPGGAVVFALRHLFDRPDEMDRGIVGRMVEFPGTQDKFVGSRNFLTLRPDDQSRLWSSWWVEGALDEPYVKVIHAVA